MDTNANTNVFPVKHNTNTSANVFVNGIVSKPFKFKTMNMDTNVKKFKFNTNHFVNDFVNKPPKFGEIGHFDEIRKFKFLIDKTMTTIMNMTMNTTTNVNTTPNVKKFKFTTNHFDEIGRMIVGSGGGGAP